MNKLILTLIVTLGVLFAFPIVTAQYVPQTYYGGGYYHAHVTGSPYNGYSYDPHYDTPSYAYESSNVGYYYDDYHGAELDISLHDYAYGDNCYTGANCGDRYHYYGSDNNNDRNKKQEQKQLVRKYNQVFQDEEYFDSLKYGQPTVDVYSGYQEQSEPVPASNWRNKEVFDQNDYTHQNTVLSTPLSHTKTKIIRGAGISETATTPYYYEPVYDNNLGYYNWRY